MAFLHGKTSKFQMDDSGGVLRDLSVYCDEVSLSRSIETAETTTFGVTGSAKTYLTGLVDATVSIKGKFDAGGATFVDAVIAGVLGQTATVSWEYQASNASPSATNPRYNGEGIVTSYEVSSPVGDVVSFSAEIQVTGVVTRSTS